MNIDYPGIKGKDFSTPATLESVYAEFILPIFGINKPVMWQRHVQTDPDNFVHVFAVDEVYYALAFDDYPSGFSVDGEPFVKAMRLENGDKIAHVGTNGQRYIENVTGAFMLFQVLDDVKFEAYINFLEIEYTKLQANWHQHSVVILDVSRDIIQLAETAALNHDKAALYSLQQIIEAFLMVDAHDTSVSLDPLKEYVTILLDAEFGYEVYDEAEKERAQARVYATLAAGTEHTVTALRYAAQHLGQTVTLVTAMYAKKEGDTTSGTSVTLLFDGGIITYPAEHFLDDELKNYFANNPYIAASNIAYHMPEQLQDYRLVAGSVEARWVFRRELEYVSF